jgi:hypothetical protein
LARQLTAHARPAPSDHGNLSGKILHRRSSTLFLIPAQREAASRANSSIPWRPPNPDARFFNPAIHPDFHAAERCGRANSSPEGQFEEKSPDFHNRADTTSI